jgi:methionine biosynthesis protein MetW
VKYYSGVTIPYGTHQVILNAIPDGSTILDIGCAQGYLDRILTEEKGCTVYAVEYEQAAADIAKAYCKKIVVGDIEELLLAKGPRPYSDQKFDLILLADILEHLRSPEAILTQLAHYLKPGGKVIISLPNIANFVIRLKLLFGMFRYTSTGIMDSTHLVFFTRKTLREMVVHSGLTVQSISGVGQPTYLFGKFGRFGAHMGSILTNLLPTFFSIQFVLIATKPHDNA